MENLNDVIIAQQNDIIRVLKGFYANRQQPENTNRTTVINVACEKILEIIAEETNLGSEPNEKQTIS